MSNLGKVYTASYGHVRQGGGGRRISWGGIGRTVGRDFGRGRGGGRGGRISLLRSVVGGVGRWVPTQSASTEVGRRVEAIDLKEK